MKKRNISLDLLRILCCYFIIMLHESGHLELNTSYWYFIQALVRPCLWVFAALSGYFVLTKTIENKSDFYLKNIPKIFISLIIYGVFYQVIDHVGEITGIRSFLKYVSIKNIIAGDITGHMWFAYSICGLYLITPFLQKFLNYLKQKDLIHFLIFLFIFIWGKPLLVNYGVNIGIDIPFNDLMLFYYILGYYIKKYGLPKFNIYIFLIGLINVFVIHMEFHHVQLVVNLCTTSLPMLIGVLVYFILFMSIKIKENKLFNKIVIFISERTFGIYLIHYYVMQKIIKITIFQYNDYNKYYIPWVNTTVNFVISLILAVILDYIFVKPIFKIYNQFIKFMKKTIKKKVVMYREKRIKETKE